MDVDAGDERFAVPARGGPAKSRWFAAWALALALGACDRGAADVPQMNIAAPAAIEVPPRPPPALDPACAPGREGKYQGYGNRWGRYEDICIDRVRISFEAYPDDASLNYSIESVRCPGLGRFGSFRKPEKMFERPVPEQIETLRSAVAGDLREFARRCSIRLDPAPFVDERFDRFYLDFGDGWWFDRIDGGYRLTPDIMEKPAGTARR